MPYEFGPGADIDLYPEVRLAPATDVRRTAPSIVPVAGRAPLDGTLRHRTAPPAESRNDTTDGAADGSSSTSPARSSNEDDPINADLHRQLDAARSADQPETRHGSAMSIDALNAFFAVRFDRERDLRIEILNAKLSEVDDLEVGEILSLTEDEVVQIRGIVDAELPLDVPYPQYLPLTGYGAIDREGRFGAVNYRAQQRRNRADRENAARTDAATTPSSPAQAPTDGAVETPEIEASSDEDVRSALVVDADGTEVDTSERAGIDDDQRSTLAGDTSSTSRGASTEPDDIDQQEEISEIIASMSDLDVEMLSRRMYGRIRRTLRRELLIDRERAGTLADAC